MMWPGILKLPFLFGGTRNSLYYPVYATKKEESSNGRLAWLGTETSAVCYFYG